MNKALEIDNVGMNPPPDLRDRVWATVLVPERVSPQLGSTFNRTGGLGLEQPGYDQALDIDAWARWLLMHGRPGGENHPAGVVMNRAFWVDRRSVFGYLLGKALAPQDTKGRAYFLRLYAYIVACPQLYREVVSTRETANSISQPFIENSGSSITITPLEVGRNQLQNLSSEDVFETLIRNRIPFAWIDHAYTYGLHYMDIHYSGQHASTIDTVDDERL